MIAGLILGLTSGYLGGRVDLVIMRLLDIVFAFPVFLLAIAVIAALLVCGAQPVPSRWPRQSRARQKRAGPAACAHLWRSIACVC